MAAPPPPLLLLLLMMMMMMMISVGALLPSETQTNPYSQLSPSLKGGVDLALEKLHSHAAIQQYLVFLRSLSTSDVQAGFGVAFIYHHFYLKPTNCPKGTADVSGCRHRNDRPLIDCTVCYKTLRGEIEPQPKPYVHCIHKTALTQEMKDTRVKHCNQLSYSSGDTTLLASTGNEDA
ncbi:hypothetical protein D4764_17G0002950 [Takifugu flavidus]|uniref:Retinoic acid receptor responder protein 2 n=1 Tax=Takifugu flavidus TaxID=433684 RepID=A0A5C6NTI1_9TELE|nr:hypothetical protein D4764_17G0002950 [Takifugu flavidus]